VRLRRLIGRRCSQRGSRSVQVASAQPAWTPPVYSDVRAAWTGSLAERPDTPMRIEAASYRGKTRLLPVDWPVDPSRSDAAVSAYHRELAFLGTSIVLFLSMLLVGAILARRNLRLGRGDRRGASRLAAFVFVCATVEWLFGAHHVPNLNEFSLFLSFLASAGFLLSLLGSLYRVGAIRPPALARRAGLLEPRAGRKLSGSTGGTGRACGLPLGGVAGRN